MAVHRLTGLDTIFLAAENARNPLHMMAILLLDPSSIPGGYQFESMRDFIGERLPLLTPLRRRLVEVPFGLYRPIWIEETDLDLDHHIRRAAVPSPGSLEQVAEIATQINEHLLDRSRPLWEMVLVEGVEDGRVALIVKLHHAMMDGFAGVRLMSALISSTPEIPELPDSKPLPSIETPSELEMLVRSIPKIAVQPARAALALTRGLGLRLQSIFTERDKNDAPAEEPPRSVLNTQVTAKRNAALVSLPLGEMRAVGRAFGVTVNDVLLASISGALVATLGARGELPDLSLVAGVPVSTHDEDDDLSNSTSSLFTSLATDLGTPRERLLAIHDSAQRAKSRQSRMSSDFLAEVADVPAPWVWSSIVALYTRLGLSKVAPLLCNLVVSNVPGPPTSLYLAGARIECLFPLGPIFEGLGLNITAISTGKKLDIGLVASPNALRDPWEVAEAIPTALADLIKLVD